jgi:glucan phosphoethanolaminetransferase (alkaline phosphatase superfamily)
VKTAKKILEELGAWLMAVTFIFLMFKLVAFMVVIVYSGNSTQTGSYNISIDSRRLQHYFKSDTVEIKPVVLK